MFPTIDFIIIFTAAPLLAGWALLSSAERPAKRRALSILGEGAVLFCLFSGIIIFALQCSRRLNLAAYIGLGGAAPVATEDILAALFSGIATSLWQASCEPKMRKPSWMIYSALCGFGLLMLSQQALRYFLNL